MRKVRQNILKKEANILVAFVNENIMINFESRGLLWKIREV